MGTSYQKQCCEKPYRDHPHAYGDKKIPLFVKRSCLGSSPRVWGQVKFCGTADKNTGIIPTRMGTSCRTNVTHSVIKDHPHAYGDKLSCLCLGCRVAGSSPRVWGQAAVTKANMEEIGIIPTRMGTRLKKSRKIAVLQNQPLRFPLTFHRSFV